MRAITIDARSEESARALCEALAKFKPSMSGSATEGYRVSVDLSGGDRRIVELLNALEQHVQDRADPARVQLDGRSYVVGP